MADEQPERDVPESGSGAAPGDDRTPEHSRGIPLDDPQPSAARREDLETEEEKTGEQDVEPS